MAEEFYRFNFAGRKRYVKLMSQHKNISLTKYLQELIDKDMSENKELYNKLLSVENDRLSIKGE